MKKRRKSKYSSDKPISKFPEDVLGRGEFARCLAHDISAWKGGDSLVIGLYGSWGSGKTSIKNLIVSDLKKRKVSPKVIQFNPWQVSGTGAIMQVFFEELRIALHPGPDDSKEAIERAKKLGHYSKRLALAGVAGKVFGSLLTVFGNVEEGAALTLAAEGAKQAAEVTNAGANVQEADGNSQSLSLEELKRSLDESLRRLERPLLVIIDDIDRLSTREILDVIQLVKANADFPNLTYLLLFERGIVSKALDQISDNRGKEFLEKIVQVGYHVPHAPKAAIQKVLFRGLNELLALPGVDRRWNQDRWTELYLDGLVHFFGNLRHVYRFLSSLDFHVRQFQASDQFEVNPVDLISLETLRVFEPDVFERLASEKRVLTRNAGKSFFNSLDQKMVDATMDDIVGKAAKQRMEHVRSILKHLFPPVTEAYSGDEIGRDTYQWLRDARVCHVDLFDHYFSLAVQEGELAQSELDRLIESAGKPKEFLSQVHTLRERKLLLPVIQRLDAYKDEIPTDKLPGLIQALAEISDDLPAKAPGMSEIEPRSVITRMVYSGLRREKNLERRHEILLDAFTASRGVLLPVYFTGLQERDSNEESKDRDFLVSKEQWQNLKELCLEKLRVAAADGKLEKHPEASMLLWRWSDWAIEEVRAWVATKVSSPEGALWLINVLLGEVHSHGQKFEIHYYLKLGNVERFIDWKVIEVEIDKIEKEKVGERERAAIREFKRAVERRRVGKSDSDGWQRSMLDDEDE